jgi:hypothetical protein
VCCVLCEGASVASVLCRLLCFIAYSDRSSVKEHEVELIFNITPRSSKYLQCQRGCNIYLLCVEPQSFLGNVCQPLKYSYALLSIVAFRLMCCKPYTVLLLSICRSASQHNLSYHLSCQMSCTTHGSSESF